MELKLTLNILWFCGSVAAFLAVVGISVPRGLGLGFRLQVSGRVQRWSILLRKRTWSLRIRERMIGPQMRNKLDASPTHTKQHVASNSGMPGDTTRDCACKVNLMDHHMQHASTWATGKAGSGKRDGNGNGNGSGSGTGAIPNN